MHRAARSVRYEKMIEGIEPGESEPGEPGTTPGAGPYPDSDGNTRAKGRQALRAARRRRRRISIVCAVFVAGCTAITLLIVGIASSRASSPQAVTPSAPMFPDVHVDYAALPSRAISTNQSYRDLDAAASRGGHR